MTDDERAPTLAEQIEQLRAELRTNEIFGICCALDKRYAGAILASLERLQAIGGTGTGTGTSGMFPEMDWTL